MISIWLGSRASIWSHRGYHVRGESVICDDRDDAESVLAREFGDDLVEAESGDGGTTYYYETQEACDADLDGSRALAAISVEDDEDDES